MARVLKDTGLIIIADFDEQGFELMSRVHSEEGREHPKTAATVTLAHDELLRIGFRRMQRTTGSLHEVVVLLKA